MPANNKKTRTQPADGTSAPNAIYRKTLQEALIDGLKTPSEFCKDFLDIDPYPKQAEFLNASRDCSEATHVAGNRTGKSWLGGATLLWRAFYRYISPYTAPDRRSPHAVYKAVSTSLTQDQAKLCWNYALTFATESKRFRTFLGDVVHSPFPTMTIRTKNEQGEWVNSEIWARSLAKGGLYLLGHSLGFVQTDECAYIKGYPTIEDEVLRMRLADQGGSLFRISTPNSRNFFYTYFLEGLKGDPRIYAQRITTLDNPYVSKAFIEDAKRRMVAEYYAQNVLAEFVSLSDFFKLDVIAGLYTQRDEKGREEGIEYELPVARHPQGRYVMGVDLGAQRDATVAFVWRIDVKPYEVVYVNELRNQSWRASREFVKSIHRQYVPEQTFIDATGVGAPIVQQLMDEDNLEGVTPFVFSASSKPDALVRLQDAAQQRRFIFPFCAVTKTLVDQMSFYKLDDKQITQDYVLALALVNLAAEAATKGNQMFSELYDDLQVIPVRGGGSRVPLDMFGEDEGDLGTGTFFDYDAAVGLFVPRGD